MSYGSGAKIEPMEGRGKQNEDYRALNCCNVQWVGIEGLLKWY